MLTLDIDQRQISQIAKELSASDKDVVLAFNRALSRTAGAMRRKSSKGLKDELQLRNAKAIRNRLKILKRKGGRSGSQIRLWFGANDLPVSAFKGRPKKTSRGAAFRNQEFPGGFVVRTRSGKTSIFKRVGKKTLPITEQRVPIQEDMQAYLEDEVFAEVEVIFFKNFRADLRARTIYGVGGRR